jgi:signal peptidase I
MLALILLFAFVSPVTVKGGSMDSTLYDGQMIAVTRIKPSSVKVGEVVIIGDVTIYGNKENIVKRVIATAGEEIAFAYSGETDDNGRAVVGLYKKRDGIWQRIDEHYIKEPMTAARFSSSDVNASADAIVRSIVLGADEIYVMGDNRNNSSDSRVFGAFKTAKVKAKMLFDISGDPVMDFIFNKLCAFIKGESIKND